MERKGPYRTPVSASYFLKLNQVCRNGIIEPFWESSAHTIGSKYIDRCIKGLQIEGLWSVIERGFKRIYPAMLRFENSSNKKMLKQAWHFFLSNYSFVTAEGFKPPTLRAEI